MGEWLERNNLSIKRNILKFETIEHMMRTRMDFNFWKRRTEIFLQRSFNKKNTHMKTDSRLLM